MAHRAGRNNAAAAGGDDAASVSAFFALVSYNIVCGAGRKAPPVLLPCGGMICRGDGLHPVNIFEQGKRILYDAQILHYYFVALRCRRISPDTKGDVQSTAEDKEDYQFSDNTSGMKATGIFKCKIDEEAEGYKKQEFAGHQKTCQ